MIMLDKFEGGGVADFRCNICKKIVKRNLGWKLWTPSFCESTGRNARLYRISAPIEKKGCMGNSK
jgi:hypothetical protein